MREQVIRCDKCGSVGAEEISVFIESCIDASGNNGTKDAVFDLCDRCQADAFRKLLVKLERVSVDRRAILHEVLGFSPEVFE